MFKKIYFIALIFTLFPLSETIGQKVTQIRIPELEAILKAKDDKLYVINFWATWCPPCVKEMPHFNKVAWEYDQDKVKFLFISLDFPSQIETHLIPFLQKNEIYLDVALMLDLDYNAWINKVDPSWQGNIPATLFFNNKHKKRYFHPGEMDDVELRKTIKSLI